MLDLLLEGVLDTLEATNPPAWTFLPNDFQTGHINQKPGKHQTGIENQRISPRMVSMKVAASPESPTRCFGRAVGLGEKKFQANNNDSYNLFFSRFFFFFFQLQRDTFVFFGKKRSVYIWSSSVGSSWVCWDVLPYRLGGLAVRRINGLRNNISSPKPRRVARLCKFCSCSEF